MSREVRDFNSAAVLDALQKPAACVVVLAPTWRLVRFLLNEFVDEHYDHIVTYSKGAGVVTVKGGGMLRGITADRPLAARGLRLTAAFDYCPPDQINGRWFDAVNEIGYQLKMAAPRTTKEGE